MAITLKEIAKIAGVSITTVSRVVNNKAIGNMSKETYERIKKIIDITGYAPNPMATALRGIAARVIGVILPSSANPYYSQLGNYIENEAYKNNHLIFICNSNSDSIREKNYISLLKQYNVSGILLCSTGLTNNDIEELSTDKLKFVLLDEDVRGFKGNIILGNDQMGGYKAAQYLYSLGHANVLIILGPEQLISTQERLNGFLGYFREQGIEYDRNLIVQGDFTIQSGYEGVKNLITRNKPFSAIFSMNDLMAIGAMQSLKESAISVPGEVSILGYDNIFIDQYISPMITTIATPLEQLAQAAVQKILSEDKAGDEPGRQLIEPILIERESCKKIN